MNDNLIGQLFRRENDSPLANASLCFPPVIVSDDRFDYRVVLLPYGRTHINIVGLFRELGFKGWQVTDIYKSRFLNASVYIVQCRKECAQ